MQAPSRRLYALELGVGHGGHGRDRYRRLHYLMGDYSAHILELARVEVRGHDDHVSGLVLEATRLSGSVGEGDIRMHVSNGTLASFADTLPLLHPFGRLVCHDLFTTSAARFGRRRGFDAPFPRSGSALNRTS